MNKTTYKRLQKKKELKMQNDQSPPDQRMEVKYRKPEPMFNDPWMEMMLLKSARKGFEKRGYR